MTAPSSPLPPPGTTEPAPPLTDDPNEVVGHKSFDTGEIGPDGFPILRHEPLTRAEADKIWLAFENARQRRAREMPTEKEAMAVMFDAYQRLQELGWADACYCPKDGSTFNVIEARSTGIHKAHYSGKWPDGTFWLEDGGDLWPSRPILYREIKS